MRRPKSSIPVPFGPHNRRRALIMGGAVVTAGVTAVAGGALPAHAAPTTFTVQNTNDSGVGSLRQAILDANNSVNTQISQINDLILAKVNVILIDPTSSTALNGVISKAMAAGIKVLVFSDGPVTSTKPLFNWQS